MQSSARFSTYTCARCLRVKRLPFLAFSAPPSPHSSPYSSRRHTQAANQRPGDAPSTQNDGQKQSEHLAKEKDVIRDEEEAMTRRLREMSEDALVSSGRGASKLVQEAGFGEDLKSRLEERIAAAAFRAENKSAFAEAELPSSAGRATRYIATAEPWSGTESIHDASLRMLQDAHTPLRGRASRLPGPSPQMPRSIDTGRTNKGVAGTRLANARDRSGIYSSLKESDIDEVERQKRFQELKDRFSPNARAVVPGTIQGLASLANERIENAIARGQFKNLPNRGKVVERDYNASNPFLDTTEYFMNKIIQKQEIVPPWIEKQQELAVAASKFRGRLRNDWKRHAARMIASRGGSLAEQMGKAEAYAKAEALVNPQGKKEEALSAADAHGQSSQITRSGEVKVPSSPSTSEPVVNMINTEQHSMDEKNQPPLAHNSVQQTNQILIANSAPSSQPAQHLFRDPQWLAIENSYFNAAITNLNHLTRSYNLQAPDLAKKPYFSLTRELNACYADVAPQLANEIKERATRPARKKDGLGQNYGGTGIMDRLIGEPVRVRDERVGKQYGFRQFWKDVWGTKASA